MTQEEKAKAYDEAIRKLRGMMPNWERLSYNGKTFLQDLIHIFPELAESEDEKIRKELVKVFSNKEKYLIDQSFGDITVSEVLAWLEKQGDNNAKWSDKEELHIKQLESLVKKVWAIAEHEDDKDTIREMSDLSFFLKTLNPEKKGEKSHGWSEEDERIYQSIIDDAVQENLLYNEQINWLISIKKRIS